MLYTQGHYDHQLDVQLEQALNIILPLWPDFNPYLGYRAFSNFTHHVRFYKQKWFFFTSVFHVISQKRSKYINYRKSMKVLSAISYDAMMLKWVLLGGPHLWIWNFRPFHLPTQVAEQFGPDLVKHWQIRAQFAISVPAPTRLDICRIWPLVLGPSQGQCTHFGLKPGAEWHCAHACYAFPIRPYLSLFEVGWWACVHHGEN